MRFCAGDCLFAKDCTLLKYLRKSARCDIKFEVLTASEADLVLVFVFPVSYSNSDEERFKAEAGIKVFKEKIAEVLAEEKANA